MDDGRMTRRSSGRHDMFSPRSRLRNPRAVQSIER
jgi:hypothetical protein